ncbi:MAG TPA: ComF family protein [Anaerolineae bacterium]|nr:ComF family protein [Anaerolineae bacterium]
MFRSLLDLVFPPRCRLCRKPSTEVVCTECFESFPKISGTICRRCGKPCRRTVDECRDCTGKILHFSLARSGGSYAGSLKEAIHHLKYKNGKKIALYLARFIADCSSELMDNVGAIAFVPLTRYKEAKRGYNQSKLIAQELSLLFNKPLYRDLVKIRDIPEQNKLGLADRSSNVKGVFVAKAQVSGRMLLVDDVYTTGSTVNECAIALRKAGASEVLVVTVARTPLEGR